MARYYVQDAIKSRIIFTSNSRKYCLEFMDRVIDSPPYNTNIHLLCVYENDTGGGKVVEEYVRMRHKLGK